MAQLDTRIFRDRQFAATPPAVSEAIYNLCSSLSSEEPLYVPCFPEGAPGECFFNVRAKVARAGGRVLYGWAIWEWRRVFIEAEHHAVWSEGEELIDLTPHQPAAEERILFLPDPNSVYDYENLRRRPNVKRSLGIVPGVQAWLDATDRLHSFFESHSTRREITVPADEYRRLHGKTLEAQTAVVCALARITQPKDKCICRSGRQFRRCCRQYIAK